MGLEVKKKKNIFSKRGGFKFYGVGGKLSSGLKKPQAQPVAILGI